jgi:hypothetical protein
MEMQLSGPEHLDRGIEALLEGSIELAFTAWRTGDSASGHVLARSSLLSSMLYGEACANACIDSLILPKKLTEDIEKLTTLSKFDLFCRLRNGSSFDRGDDSAQGFAELMSLRNKYAHPKAQQVQWNPVNEFSSVATSPRTKHLRIPTIISYCTPDDAIKGLRGTHAFMRHLFKDICSLSPSETSAFLLSTRRVPTPLDSHHKRTAFTHVEKWLKDNNVPLDYLESWVIF